MGVFQPNRMQQGICRRLTHCFTVRTLACFRNKGTLWTTLPVFKGASRLPLLFFLVTKLSSQRVVRIISLDLWRPPECAFDLVIWAACLFSGRPWHDRSIWCVLQVANVPLSVMFGMCSLFLLTAFFCQHRFLLLSVRSRVQHTLRRGQAGR